jgi:hypothetical protein
MTGHGRTNNHFQERSIMLLNVDAVETILAATKELAAKVDEIGTEISQHTKRKLT